MVDFKADERLNTLNHSCAHVMAQAVKHLYPQAKFWVGPVVKEGFYYDIDLGDDIINDEAIAAIEKPFLSVSVSFNVHKIICLTIIASLIVSLICIRNSTGCSGCQPILSFCSYALRISRIPSIIFTR